MEKTIIATVGAASILIVSILDYRIEKLEERVKALTEKIEQRQSLNQPNHERHTDTEEQNYFRPYQDIR